MGEGLVDKLRGEAGIEFDLTWEPFELHPEIPADGIPFDEYFRGRYSFEQAQAALKERADQLGLPYAPNPLVISTRPALLVAELVREKQPERFASLHQALFQGYFVHGRNLAQAAEVEEICQELGIGPGIVAEAMAEPRYSEIIDRSMAQARRYGITGIPTWIVNDRYKIVGAQPYDVLRDAFRKIEAMG